MKVSIIVTIFNEEDNLPIW